MAKVLREVSFNALHIHGSLGTTDLTPLQAMYAGAPTMGIADGVDEVHKATVARNVLKQYRPHEGYFPTEYFPAKTRSRRGRSSSPFSSATPSCAARRGLPEVLRQPPPLGTGTSRGQSQASPRDHAGTEPQPGDLPI